MKTFLLYTVSLIILSLVFFFDFENAREIKRESEINISQNYTKELKTLEIGWVYDRETVNQILKMNKDVDKFNETIVGLVNKSENKCIIYAYKPTDSVTGRIDLETPRNRIKLQILGHELMHCFIEDLHN